MENQRPFLYIILAVICFMIYQSWNAEQAAKNAPVVAEQSSTNTTSSGNSNGVAGSIDGNGQTTAEAQQISIKTDVLNIVISTLGGEIQSVELPAYPISLDEPDTPFTLLKAEQPVYLAQSGLLHDKIGSNSLGHRAPSHLALFSSEQNSYTLADGAEELRVPLTWKNAEGIEVTKTYTFKAGQYLVDVDYTINNQSDQEWIGRQYRQLVHGTLTKDEESSFFIRTFNGSGYYNDKFHKMKFEDFIDEPINETVTGGWVSMLQHYFLSAWLPGAEESNDFYSQVKSGQGSTNYVLGMRSNSLQIAAGSEGTFKTRFVAGPKVINDLEGMAKGLDLTVDYGFFTIISKPLFGALKFIHGIVGNWGWSIILLTFGIKLAFYWLSEKSYRSMAKMRKVGPKLAELKERLGDDKQAYQQETMKLYKKEKINPVSGCWPMLIQFPVFLGLYWMLLESVELRQAPWMFWIADLSIRDPFFILPIIMGISMFVQQRLNPAPPDPMQAKIMMMMPLMFTAFSLFFPAGLVLYWITNNSLSILQQMIIAKRLEKGDIK